MTAKENTKDNATAGTVPIIQVTALLKALISIESEGRILISNPQETLGDTETKKSIKYMLLNPSSQFSELISECRSIVVAGGTMQPLSEFRDQLFIDGGADPSRVMHFSCDHVVPGENLLPLGSIVKYYVTIPYLVKLGWGYNL